MRKIGKVWEKIKDIVAPSKTWEFKGGGYGAAKKGSFNNMPLTPVKKTPYVPPKYEGAAFVKKNKKK